MSGDRFVVPEEKVSYASAWKDKTEVVLASQVPAIVRAEVERALQWMAPHLHTHWAGYCAERFGPASCTCPRPSSRYTGDCPVHPKADSQLCGSISLVDGPCTHRKGHLSYHSWQKVEGFAPPTWEQLREEPSFTPDERTRLERCLAFVEAHAAWLMHALEHRTHDGFSLELETREQFRRAEMDDAARKVVEGIGG